MYLQPEITNTVFFPSQSTQKELNYHQVFWETGGQTEFHVNTDESKEAEE